MPFLHDDVLDNGIAYIDANAEDLHICSQEPATYAEAVTTYTLGDKNGIAVGVPEDGDASGRKVTVAAITDGAVTGTGTASHYAIVDVTNTKLLVANALAASEGVTDGNPFTLPAFDIEVPDPT